MLKMVPCGAYLRVKLGQHDAATDVHVLVMLAFRGPRPSGLIVRHWDDNGKNNHLSNLHYGTYSQNYEDAIRNGRVRYGERHYRAKLTEEAVREIRESKLTMKQLAILYGVSPTTIHNAKHGRNWGRLDADDKAGTISASVGCGDPNERAGSHARRAVAVPEDDNRRRSKGPV